MRAGYRRFALAVLLALAMAVPARGVGWPPTGDAEPADVRTLRATTSTGRGGSYYLPSDHALRPLPLLVMLHGTGGKGSLAIVRLVPLAERERFIALAPDSTSVAGVWVTRSGAAGPAEDHRHVVASVREVLGLPGVQIDRGRVLIAGFSAGAAAAAHLASHEDVFTAFAVLHGHVMLDALGPRRARAWLSTGDRDRLRTVAQLRSLAGELTRRAGFADVQVRVFPADHTLASDELAALVAWWLPR